MNAGIRVFTRLSKSYCKVKRLNYQQIYAIIDTHEYEKEKIKLSKVRAFLKEFMLVLVEGTKDTYRDLRWLALLYKRKNYRHFTGFEKKENYRILKDALKFIPFSFFLIIPGAELVLPLYVALFPNSIPTQYIFDHTWDEYIEQMEIKQKAAHEELVKPLKDFLIMHGMKTEHFLDQDKYKKHFFANLNLIEQQLNYKEFDSEQLVKVCQFMGIQYITGTFIISTILRIILNSPRYIINLSQVIAGSKHRTKFNHWIFNYEIKLNFFPFKYLKRKFLLFQINKHMEKIRQQDISFYSFGMHDVRGHLIKDIARERGIISLSCYETLKAIITNQWVSTCMTLNNNSIIYYAMMQYDILQSTNSEFN